MYIDGYYYNCLIKKIIVNVFVLCNRTVKKFTLSRDSDKSITFLLILFVFYCSKSHERNSTSATEAMAVDPDSCRSRPSRTSRLYAAPNFIHMENSTRLARTRKPYGYARIRSSMMSGRSYPYCCHVNNNDNRTDKKDHTYETNKSRRSS